MEAFLTAVENHGWTSFFVALFILLCLEELRLTITNRK